MLALSDVMSTFPVRMDASGDVDSALQLLSEHGFHHLPVFRGEALDGVLSLCQLDAARVAGGGGVLLGDLVASPPLVFDISVHLRQVAIEMGRRSLDAAVILSRGRVVGIVTSSDLLGVLTELLPGPPPGSPPSDVA